ncbi:MAG: peptide ABC transporter substrate-binding protein [Rubellimicrobium sp.]|nr:peptide ABC transporter substrate-binding protein [Rubellimicrobium sp.]
MTDTTQFTLNRRKTLMLMGAAGLTSAVPGIGGLRGAAFAKDAPSGQVIIGFSQEPTVFNPHMPHIEVDDGIHYAIFDPLVDVDPDGIFYPLLAAEVPTVENGGISADGLNWRVKLRDDARWHDGTPFAAEDVKFTLDLLNDPDFRAWRRVGTEFVRDIEVVSPTEITWRLEQAYAPFLAILASTFIVPKHAFDGVDPNEAPFNNAPIGTGAFKLKNRVPGDHIELEANTDYFGDGPYLERAVIKYIPDMTVMYTQFKTGDIDMLALQWITPDHYEEARNLPDRVVEIVGNPFFESIQFNMERPQFKDPAVRQALYLALDKPSIIEALYYDVPPVTETFMPRESYYYNDALPAHEFSIDKANALLDEAGWARGADGVREKDGVRLAFRNSTTSGNELREQVQQFVQQTWAEIGVEMEISNLPPAVMWGDFWSMGQYDTTLVGLGVLAGPDPDCSDFFRSDASPALGGTGQNYWAYQNAEADDLLARGASLFSPEERRPLYLRLQEVIREDLPFLPIYQYAVIPGRKAGLEGPHGNINNRIDTWNLRSWRWV